MKNLAIGSRGQYLIGNPIGQGCFGKVFLCKETATQDSFVLKIITNQKPDPTFEELNISEKVGGIKGFSKLIDSGEMVFEEKLNRFLVFNRLGENINAYMKSNYILYDLEETMKIGIDILDALEKLHNLRYVHGDIKPNNIVMETEFTTPHDLRQFYLIDFGLSRRYLTSANKHIPNDFVPFNSNEWFASKHLFNNETASRRDDIISLIYSLLYIHTQFATIQLTETVSTIGDFKTRCTAEEFCQGSQRSLQFLAVLQEAYSYSFEQEPHYAKIRFMFQQILMAQGLKPNKNFQYIQEDEAEEMEQEENTDENPIKYITKGKEIKNGFMILNNNRHNIKQS